MSDENLVPFLALNEATLKVLLPQGAVRRFPKDTAILHAEDHADSFYIVLSGCLKAFVSDDAGKVFIIGSLGAGDYFGEAVLDGGQRTASVTTEGPCRLFVVPRNALAQFIGEHPDFARSLVGNLIQKMRKLTFTIRQLALHSAQARLIMFIDERAVTREDGARVTDRLTQRFIASRVGTSREMVSRLIGELTEAGYIALDNKKIVVLRPLPRSR